MPIHVLIVDNDHDSVADLKDLLDDDSQYTCAVANFGDATDRIRSAQPDIVVADLLDDDDGDGDGDPGNAVVDFVWEKHFCPLVIYSAEPSRVKLPDKEHPLVALQEKGDRSDEEALAKIRSLAPYCAAFRTGHEENRQRFAEAMRDAAMGMSAPAVDASGHIDTVFRAARRRFAAALDEGRTKEALMGAWEQYLCPPLSSDLLTGDVLRDAASVGDRPEDFSVVLTPSCDLAQDGDREPKVSRILVAKGLNMRDALERSGFPPVGKNLDVPRLARVVGPGYEGGVLFLPRLPGHIPAMGANLRDLDLLLFDEIGERGSDTRYVRIASMDSPFRELVSWAYLQNTGRPGLPDRDSREWAREILGMLKRGGEKK